MGKREIVNLMNLNFEERQLLADAYGFTGIEVYPSEGVGRVNAAKAMGKVGVLKVSKIDDGYIVTVTKKGEQLWETGSLAPADAAPANASEPAGDVDGDMLANYEAIFHDVIEGHLISTPEVQAGHGQRLLAHIATLQAQLAAAEGANARLRKTLEGIARNALATEPTGKELPAWTYM